MYVDFCCTRRERMCILHAYWILQICCSLQVSSSPTCNNSFRLCKFRISYNTCIIIFISVFVLAFAKITLFSWSSTARISNLRARHIFTFPRRDTNVSMEQLPSESLSSLSEFLTICSLLVRICTYFIPCLL
jgi:hypothetical protein